MLSQCFAGCEMEIAYYGLVLCKNGILSVGKANQRFLKNRSVIEGLKTVQRAMEHVGLDAFIEELSGVGPKVFCDHLFHISTSLHQNFESQPDSYINLLSILPISTHSSISVGQICLLYSDIVTGPATISSIYLTLATVNAPVRSLARIDLEINKGYDM